MLTQMVQDLMTPDPACCTPQDAITDVARMMVEEDCGAIPVVESQESRRVVGIITDRDIVVRIVARGEDVAAAQVAQAMSSDVSTLRTDANIDDCVRLMSDYQVRRVPIVDESGTLVGMVSQADLARASSQEADLESELTEMVEEVSQP